MDFGLTLYSPDHTPKWAAHRFTCDTKPSYLVTVDQFAIGHGTVEEATEYFIVGNYPDARSIVYSLNPNNAPNTPSNPSPSNHATGQSINADLSWTGGDPDTGDTVKYDVFFGTSTSPPLVSNDQSGTTHDPGTLSYNTKYYWKITATDNHGASTSGSLWDFTTGSAPNNAPTLSSGSVTPSSGDASTTFNYYVTYADSDGDAPTTKYVYVDGFPHMMTKISGDYTSGAMFKYSTTLSAGSHNYYFYFDDGHGHTKRLPTSGTSSGPTVLTPNQPPTLSSGSVNPSSGDTSTTFNYYVTYTDSDGDTPTTKYVYVDGFPHMMTKISGDYTSGAMFKYSTTLSAGSHNYYFYFDDGHGHTKRLPTSGTSSGPTVSTPTDPMISISYPTNGQTLTTASITVSGSASDNVGLSKVGSEGWIWKLADRIRNNLVE